MKPYMQKIKPLIYNTARLKLGLITIKLVHNDKNHLDIDFITAT